MKGEGNTAGPPKMRQAAARATAAATATATAAAATAAAGMLRRGMWHPGRGRGDLLSLGRGRKSSSFNSSRKEERVNTTNIYNRRGNTHERVDGETDSRRRDDETGVLRGDMCTNSSSSSSSSQNREERADRESCSRRDYSHREGGEDICNTKSSNSREERLVRCTYSRRGNDISHYRYQQFTQRGGISNRRARGHFLSASERKGREGKEEKEEEQTQYRKNYTKISLRRCCTCNIEASPDIVKYTLPCCLLPFCSVPCFRQHRLQHHPTPAATAASDNAGCTDTIAATATAESAAHAGEIPAAPEAASASDQEGHQSNLPRQTTREAAATRAAATRASLDSVIQTRTPATAAATRAAANSGVNMKATTAAERSVIENTAAEEAGAVEVVERRTTGVNISTETATETAAADEKRRAVADILSFPIGEIPATFSVVDINSLRAADASGVHIPGEMMITAAEEAGEENAVAVDVAAAGVTEAAGVLEEGKQEESCSEEILTPATRSKEEGMTVLREEKTYSGVHTVNRTSPSRTLGGASQQQHTSKTQTVSPTRAEEAVATTGGLVPAAQEAAETEGTTGASAAAAEAEGGTAAATAGEAMTASAGEAEAAAGAVEARLESGEAAKKKMRLLILGSITSKESASCYANVATIAEGEATEEDTIAATEAEEEIIDKAAAREEAVETGTAAKEEIRGKGRRVTAAAPPGIEAAAAAAACDVAQAATTPEQEATEERVFCEIAERQEDNIINNAADLRKATSEEIANMREEGEVVLLGKKDTDTVIDESEGEIREKEVSRRAERENKQFIISEDSAVAEEEQGGTKDSEIPNGEEEEEEEELTLEEQESLKQNRKIRQALEESERLREALREVAARAGRCNNADDGRKSVAELMALYLSDPLFESFCDNVMNALKWNKNEEDEQQQKLEDGHLRRHRGEPEENATRLLFA